MFYRLHGFRQVRIIPERLALWLAIVGLLFAVGLSGCGSESEESATGGSTSGDMLPPEAAPILEGISADFDERGVAADQRRWSLYRYPRVVEAGEAVVNEEGKVIGTAPAQAAVWWADLSPNSLWMHPGRLFFADINTGEILASHPTFLWPEQVGNDAVWGLFDTADIHPDAVVPPTSNDRMETKAAEAPSKGSAQMALQEGGEECVPNRHAFLVFGRYKDSEINIFTSNWSLMHTLATKWGVKEKNIYPVMNEANKELTLAHVDNAFNNAKLKCCDEVIFYYFGHGHLSKYYGAKSWVGMDYSSSFYFGPNNKVKGNEIAKLIGKTEACNWLVIIDQCFAQGPAEDIVAEAAKDPNCSKKKISVVHSTQKDEYAEGGTFATKPKGTISDNHHVTGSIFTVMGLGSLIDFSPDSFSELTTKLVDEIATTTWKGYNYRLDNPELTESPGTEEYKGEGECCDCYDNSDCKQPDKECRCAACEQGKCIEEAAVDKPCNDGKYCTKKDRCNEQSKCEGVFVNCALSDVDSDNHHPQCAEASCDEEASQAAEKQVCVAEPHCKELDCSCVDDNKCTTPDKCDEVQCKAGPQKDCNDLDLCTTDSCDTATGTCKNTPIPECCKKTSECAPMVCHSVECIETVCVYDSLNDADCDDGDKCTLEDICQDGACVGKSPKNCDDGNDCTDDSCSSPDGTCLHAAATGTPCTLKCIDNAVCTQGKCGGGKEKDCDDNDKCTADVCDESTGKCKHVPIVMEGCGPYECTGDSDCDDDDECTADTCDGGTCKHEKLSDWGCSDGDACTTNDVCVKGVCGGIPVTCDDGNNCTSEKCDTLKGCTFPAKQNGAPCDDGDSCTVEDCQDGKCVSKAKDCNDNKDCTDDSCGVDGECVFTPKSSGDCNDGDPCTANDKCTAGVCGGTPVSSCCLASEDCDDKDDCTTDTCSNNSCINEPIAGCGADCVFDTDCPTSPCAVFSCIDGACIADLEVYEVAPGGAIYPEQLGAPAEIPLAYDYGIAARAVSTTGMGLIFETLEPIPKTPEAGISLIDFTLVLYGPGICDPGIPHPPLAGATHMLSVTWTAETQWKGHLFAYQSNGFTGAWTLVETDIPFLMEENVIEIGAEIPNVDACTPYKFLVQVVKDKQLIWKMLTQGPDGEADTNPDGPPFDPKN